MTTTTNPTTFTFAEFEAMAKEKGATAIEDCRNIWTAYKGSFAVRVIDEAWKRVQPGPSDWHCCGDKRKAATAAIAALVEKAEREKPVEEMTAEEADKAYEEAEPVPISDAEIDRLVKVATSGSAQPKAAEPTTLAQFQEVARGVDQRLQVDKSTMKNRLRITCGQEWVATCDVVTGDFWLITEGGTATTWFGGTFLDCCKAAAQLLPPVAPTASEAESRLAELKQLADENGLELVPTGFKCHYELVGDDVNKCYYSASDGKYQIGTFASWTTGSPRDFIEAVLATREQPPTPPVIDEAAVEAAIVDVYGPTALDSVEYPAWSADCINRSSKIITAYLKAIKQESTNGTA